MHWFEGIPGREIGPGADLLASVCDCVAPEKWPLAHQIGAGDQPNYVGESFMRILVAGGLHQILAFFYARLAEPERFIQHLHRTQDAN
jgi:hypothetical protein